MDGIVDVKNVKQKRTKNKGVPRDAFFHKEAIWKSKYVLNAGEIAQKPSSLKEKTELAIICVKTAYVNT